MSKQFPISLDNLIDNYLTGNYIYRPTNHKGMSQRVFKGPIGVTMFLGIFAKQPLACTGMPWEVSYVHGPIKTGR